MRAGSLHTDPLPSQGLDHRVEAFSPTLYEPVQRSRLRFFGSDHDLLTIRIDLEFGLPSARPFSSGDFADAVDYAAVVERIKALAANNPHPLVERFAESIAQLVLVEFGAPSVKVRVAKLAPLPGVRELGVMIERQAAA